MIHNRFITTNPIQLLKRSTTGPVSGR